MNITIGEIIERIQSAYSKGVKSDDSRLSSRHIYSKIKSVRNRLVVLQVKKKQKISDWNFDILPCVEMIKVRNHDCSCFIDTGCPVYRSKHKLPKILTDLNNHLIDFVITIDNGMLIDETTRREVLVAKGNKYTSKKLKYVIENGYLFVNSMQSPRILKVKAIFEDPLEAKKFVSFCEDCEDCDSECFSPLEEPLRIDSELIEPLVEMCATELLDWFNKSVEDKTNNTADSPAEQSK